MKLNIKGFVFDMDGTMFDTEQISVKSWQYAGEKFKINIPLDFMLSIMGLSSASIRKLFIEKYEGINYDAFRETNVKYAMELIEKDGVPIKPGLFPLLDTIKKRGLKCAVATSTNHERAIAHLELSKTLPYFDAVITGDMIENGKPAPDIFLRATDAMQLPPNDCIALEDSRNGILSARAAGLVPILIPDMIPPDNTMRSAAYRILPSLNEVLSLL